MPNNKKKSKSKRPGPIKAPIKIGDGTKPDININDSKKLREMDLHLVTMTIDVTSKEAKELLGTKAEPINSMGSVLGKSNIQEYCVAVENWLVKKIPDAVCATVVRNKLVIKRIRRSMHHSFQACGFTAKLMAAIYAPSIRRDDQSRGAFLRSIMKLPLCTLQMPISIAGPPPTPNSFLDEPDDLSLVDDDTFTNDDMLDRAINANVDQHKRPCIGTLGGSNYEKYEEVSVPSTHQESKDKIKIDEMEKDLANLRQQLHDAKEELELQKTMNEELRGEICARDSSIDSLNRELKDREDKIGRYGLAMDELQARTNAMILDDDRDMRERRTNANKSNLNRPPNYESAGSLTGKFMNSYVPGTLPLSNSSSNGEYQGRRGEEAPRHSSADISASTDRMMHVLRRNRPGIVGARHQMDQSDSSRDEAVPLGRDNIDRESAGMRRGIGNANARNNSG